MAKGKTVWGKKLLGGYAGVKHTAKQIVEQVPDITKYKLRVEPFSGLGRTAQYVDLPKILNDKSEYANEYCKENFSNASVSNMDFMDTINKYDAEDTFFLIDPPWRKDLYGENNMAFCDRNVWDYYNQILNTVENLKGDWFILNSADEHESKDIIRNSKWGLKIVISEGKVIFGKHARTMNCSDLFDSNVKDDFKREDKITLEPKAELKDLCLVCGATYTGMTLEAHESRSFHKGCL